MGTDDIKEYSLEQCVSKSIPYSIIRAITHVPFSNAIDFHLCINEYICKNDILEWGPIEDWDTSGVTDMNHPKNEFFFIRGMK